jgi:hypothetical protein
MGRDNLLLTHFSGRKQTPSQYICSGFWFLTCKLVMQLSNMQHLLIEKKLNVIVNFNHLAKDLNPNLKDPAHYNTMYL